MLLGNTIVRPGARATATLTALWGRRSPGPENQGPFTYCRLRSRRRTKKAGTVTAQRCRAWLQPAVRGNNEHAGDRPLRRMPSGVLCGYERRGKGHIPRLGPQRMPQHHRGGRRRRGLHPKPRANIFDNESPKVYSTSDPGHERQLQPFPSLTQKPSHRAECVQDLVYGVDKHDPRMTIAAGFQRRLAGLERAPHQLSNVSSHVRR